MKSLALASFLIGIALCPSLGQGTLEFRNINVAAGVNAPVYESDGVTKLSGTQFMAELLLGNNAANLASIATTGFLTGPEAGYFDGGPQTVQGISPNIMVFVQVDVWNTGSGASFSQARASGLANSWWSSSIFNLTLGGGVINPSLPTALVGLGNSPVFLNSVPEPSTFALASLGVALAWFRIRRRR